MRYDRQWSFHNPVKVTFGPGITSALAAPASCERGAYFTSPGFTERGLTDKLAALFSGCNLDIIDDVRPNPGITDVEAYRARLQGRGIQFVVGVGGGSVLDTAKALSYLLSIEDPGFSLRTHFNDKESLPDNRPLPLIAVPTTAGTGSEVTPFATIWDMAEKKKHSLARPDLFPAAALLDPELTLTLPREITVTTALDVLSHALESVWNHNANPVTIGLAAQAIDIFLSTLPVLLDNPQNLGYRSKMLTASLFGGLAISSTRTALAHSISYPVTAFLGAPHGLACGFTLPALLEFNLRGDQEGRLEAAASMAGYGSAGALAENIRAVFKEAGVGELMARYEMTGQNILKLAPEMFTPERAGNNLRAPDRQDLERILSASAL